MKKDLFIDIETYSSVDITKSGAYKYMESPDFEILIIGYAFDKGPVKIIDLASGEKMPDDFKNALFDKAIRKHAHNAVFERLAFKRVGLDIPADQWYCTAVLSAYCGLPLSLDNVSKALDLKDKKLATGKLLIKYFSCPCKATKINGGRTRNYPWHAPEKWELYKEYNTYDVLSEREIYYTLTEQLGYSIPEFERQNYLVDQRINDQGILVDLSLAKNAIKIDEQVKEQITASLKKLTSLENPNSTAQIKNWFLKETGLQIESLAKSVIDTVKKQLAPYPKALKVLSLREQLSKTSVKKYYAMLNCAMRDQHVRGTFQFYGANRTGRWAGRLLQLQNLSKNHLPDIATPRKLVRQGDLDSLELLYDDIPDILSQLVRTGIIAPEGKILSVADFSAIEARVISWLADEKWRLEVFHGDGKIYEATGSKMFGVPAKLITKGSELRQKSKISELALGYGGAVGAMKRMGGEAMGLSDIEMDSLTKKWRTANPKIVQLWHTLEDSAIETLLTGHEVICTCKNLHFNYDGTNLIITLPSGRSLFYRNPYAERNKRGGYTLKYKGTIQATKTWGTIETYGGKLTENIIQAIARDLLAYAMYRLSKAGYILTMHIHDEVICEVPKDGTELAQYNKMVEIMKTPPSWAADLPLNADGYLTEYYKKD